MIDGLNYEELDINSLIPYERNARTHDESQISKICDSISEFGFINPVIINKDNVIIAGHGRIEAAKRLDIKKIPCVRVENLTDEQMRAYVIVDNKLAEYAGWDLDILQFELQELNDLDFDISLTGFSLDDIMVEADPEVVEDDFSENIPINPKTKPGDIYQLGRHRLMCGDSTSIDDVDKLVCDSEINLVFTDPPYGMEYTSHRPKEEQRFEMLKNDDKILDFFPCIKDKLNGFLFVCTTWKVLDKWIPLFKNYYDLSNMIIWNKGGGGIGDLKTTFAVDYEIMLVASNKHELKGKRIGSVWDFKRDPAVDYVHPTQKPISLSGCAITETTEINNNVLDLFGGSGSTLIACEQLKRNCFMMEFDPKYVDVIINRWENLTSEKAVLLNG